MEDRLRKFARLVDAGSFTKASQELHISQPALSTAMSKLERELKAQLVVRGPRELQLTEAGKLAYATAKELLVSTRNLVSRLAVLSNEQPSIAIGMIDSAAHILASSADNLLANPSTRMSVIVNNSRHLLRAVAHSDLDMALVAEPTDAPTNLETYFLAAEPIVLACHSSQAAQLSTTLASGTLPRFISYDQASTTHGLIAAALRQHSIQPQALFFSTSPEIMLQLVKLRRGIAALPYRLVRPLVIDQTLSLLGTSKTNPIIIDRRIYLAYQRNRELPPIVDSLCKHIQTATTSDYTELQDLHFDGPQGPLIRR